MTIAYALMGIGVILLFLSGALKAKSRRPVAIHQRPLIPTHVVDPTASVSDNLRQLQSAKAGIDRLREAGVTDPDVETFEAELEKVIAEIQADEQERVEALKRQQLEQQDDICPECGQSFACNNDYICDECRAKVG